MRIQYCSDFHINRYKNYLWVKDNPLIKKADILIIAGDTIDLNEDFRRYSLFDLLAKQYEQVYLIPGNHEYYGGFDVNDSFPYEVDIRDNIKMLNNKSLVINGVKFVFTTLWSKITQNEEAILSGMADFRIIRSHDHIITIQDYNYFHEVCLKFLKKEVKERSEEKCVVVTHHLPSELCNADEFVGSTLNDAFCVDLTDFIQESNIDYWIYGHSHRNKPEININGTRMMTNQLGYVDFLEHLDYRTDAFFEI